MDRFQAGVIALFLGRFEFRGGRTAAPAFGGEVCQGGVFFRQFQRDRMIGGHANEAGTENGVGPGGKDLHLVGPVRQIERKAQTLALADPVGLHQPHLVRPILKIVQAAQQLIGKFGNLQEPLAQLAPLDRRAGTPALAVDHLFIGQHGHVDRVPIDRAFLAIDQAGGVHIQEQGLFMAVIIGFAGRQFAAPVEREADAFQLRLHVRDIGAGPCPRMDLLFHRGIFRRHAERVPAHRVQHGMAGHRLVARQHIAHRVIAHMADMDAARWIGEHLQHIGFGPVRIAIGGKARLLVPAFLPPRIGSVMIETVCHQIAISR